MRPDDGGELLDQLFALVGVEFGLGFTLGTQLINRDLTHTSDDCVRLVVGSRRLHLRQTGDGVQHLLFVHLVGIDSVPSMEFREIGFDLDILRILAVGVETLGKG